MTFTHEGRPGGVAEAIEAWWLTWGERALCSLALLQAALAVPWLLYQLWRLTLGQAPLWPGSPEGAVDLILRWREVHAWFAGQPVYPGSWVAVYPPASYALLWPWLGWLPLAAARWLWAAASLALLGWLGRLAVVQGGGRSRGQRAVLGLMAPAMYASGAAIGNGQLILLVLAALLGAVLLLQQTPGWRRDWAVALLLTVALLKPTVTAPLLCVALVVPRERLFSVARLRPFVLAAALYGGLTLLAAAFQPEGLTSLVQQWLGRGVAVAASDRGVSNLHGVLGSLRLDAWLLPASLLLVLALLGWCWWRREADLWLLLGVAAIVARLWAYHRWYDDLLLLLPLLALWRLARQASSVRWRVAAGALCALTLASTLAPGGLYLLTGGWRSAYLAAQVAIWLADLALLLAAAHSGRRPDRLAARG